MPDGTGNIIWDRDRQNGGKLITAVVPVYNVEPYLSGCLDSLCGQTYKNLELILVDDGSTDGSGTICDAYAKRDSRIQVIHKQNEGVSAARNAGIERARGEYLVFVDADDRIRPELFAIYMQAAKPGVTVICGLTTEEEEWKHFAFADWKEHVKSYGPEQFMYLYSRNHMNSPVNKCFLTSVIQENRIRFPEGKSLGEDLLFNLSYQKKMQGSWELIACPLYYYRENRENSLSSSWRSDLLEIQQESADAVRDFLKDTGLWNGENQSEHYALYWDRLFLTAGIYRAYERRHPQERRLKELLKDPLWDEVWQECKARQLLTWKRRMKRICLKLYGIMPS